MKKISITFLLGILLCTFSITSFAQCDPWITQAYKQLYGRGPTTEECNIKNYNNGSWNSYCQLVGYIAGYNRYKNINGLKGDPWVFQAYCELYNRVPTAWELNTHNYNLGSWNNYGELKTYIQNYQSSMRNNGLSVSIAPLANNSAAVLINQNGRTIAADLITNDGGTIVASGGGNVVASGGGNIVASGGGNLASLPGVGFGSNYGTLAAGTTRIPVSGRGALIIK